MRDCDFTGLVGAAVEIGMAIGMTGGVTCANAGSANSETASERIEKRVRMENASVGVWGECLIASG